MSAIVWIAEDNWAKANMGDLVKFVRGEESAIVRVNSRYGHVACIWTDSAAGFDKDDGWQLFVQAPTYVIPTEDGVYMDKHGYSWTLGGDFDDYRDLDPERAPYTRLEPVPETAKKVLDAFVQSLWGFEAPGNIPQYVAKTLEKFGVIE